MRLQNWLYEICLVRFSSFKPLYFLEFWVVFMVSFFCGQPCQYTRDKNYWSKTTFLYLAVSWSIEAWILILCCQSEQEIQSKSWKNILWFQLILNIRKYQPWWLFDSWISLTIHYNLDKKIWLKNYSKKINWF